MVLVHDLKDPGAERGRDADWALTLAEPMSPRPPLDPTISHRLGANRTHVPGLDKSSIHRAIVRAGCIGGPKSHSGGAVLPCPIPGAGAT